MVAERESAMAPTSPPTAGSTLYLVNVCGHPSLYDSVLSTISTKGSLDSLPGLGTCRMVAQCILGRVDLQKTSSRYPERCLEGTVWAPGRDLHLGLQIPHPRGWDTAGQGQVGLWRPGLGCPLVWLKGVSRELMIICFNQETTLFILKFTLKSSVWLNPSLLSAWIMPGNKPHP